MLGRRGHIEIVNDWHRNFESCPVESDDAGGKKYLVGDSASIADYFGAGLLSCSELIHLDLSKYPNVLGWYANMKENPNWGKITEARNGFAASTADQPFIRP